MALLDAPARAVDASLLHRLDTRPMAKSLRDAIAYALLGPGKRLRPALVYHSAAACGADPGIAVPAMEAIELVHCFSLVHDDLPAMDDDELRRGRATLHVHAGEAMAILAGDAMLSMAFEAISDAGNAAPLLLRELAPAVTDMVSGQVLDTLGGGENTNAPLGQLEAIHRGKTGALIRAACRMGVICAARPGLYIPTRDETAMPAITAYADALGLMFQIVDDLLDVEQSTAQLGKTAGKDAAAGKLTYPGVIGVEASRVEVVRQLDACLKALAPLGAHATPLADLARMMATRTK
ncbi:MAG: polyprenyl synthetase family protein [Planctomycetota bacterium]|nr:polyprenyl synthetase family protein [Planctomycetota bacterium]